MLRYRVHIMICWLACLLGLSACVTEDEVLEVNPTYDGDNVLVDCHLMVPPSDEESVDSRMTGQHTQNNQNFLGLGTIYLYPFQNIKAESLPGGGKQHQLHGYEFVSSDQWVKLDGLFTDPKDNVTGDIAWKEQVQMPIGTNHALIYSKAKGTQGFAQGWTATNLMDVSNDYEIPLKPRLDEIYFRPKLVTTQTVVETDAAVNWAKNMFNKVAQTQSFYYEWIGFWGWGEYKQHTVDWFMVRDNDYKNEKLIALQTAYEDFVRPNADGFYGGSTREMVARLQALYVKVNALPTSNVGKDGDKAEQIAYNMKKNILTVIKEEVDGYKLTQITSDRVTWGPKGDPNSPACINLPDGAIKLKPNLGNLVKMQTNWGDYIYSRYDKFATAEYSYKAYIDALGTSVWDVYAYPAELYYMSNSSIGCSKSKRQQSSPSNFAEWEDFVNNTKDYFEESEVSPFTRSMVVKKPLQYGVACMATKVTCANSLQDNKQSIPVSNGKLKLTGVLVRGQREVGWDFTQNTGGLQGKPYVVYDRNMNGGQNGGQPITLPNTTPNYTLLYPTAGVVDVPSETNSEQVKVWLEFENNTGKDITGKDNCVIRPGTRFYIGATLDLWKALQLDKNLAKQDRRQLFESDYKTNVTFTIKSLKGAMDIIPDTKTVEPEVGVSVDITWDDGFVFDDVIVNDGKEPLK